MLLHEEIVLIVDKLIFIIVEKSVVIRKCYFFLLRDGKELLLVNINYIKCNI